MKTLSLGLALVSASLLAGCGVVKSPDIGVRAMYFTMVLQSDNGSTVECYARVSVDNELGASVDLEGEDRLLCNGRQMSRRTATIGGYVYYTVRVPSVTEGLYRLSFERDGEEVASAENRLPPRIQLSSPAGGFTVAYDRMLRVQFQPSSRFSDVLEASLGGSYSVQGEDKTASVSTRAHPETGTLDLAPLSTLGQALPVEGLPVELSLSRRRYAKVSGGKGHFEAVQKLTVTGKAVPPGSAPSGEP